MTAHQHVWVPSRGGTERCRECGERFPCEERDCGHHDCVAHRATTTCFYCHQPIRGAREAMSKQVVNLSEVPYVVLTSRRGRTKAAHPECREKYREVP